MSTKRIKSIESNIYHRPTCKYIGFMKPGNRETLLWEDVKHVAIALVDIAIT